MNTATPTLDSDFVAAALGLELRARCGPPRAFGRAAIDSRAVQAGDLFVGLPGERRHGREFAAEAVANGAAGLLLDRLPPGRAARIEGIGGVSTFCAPDPLAALQQLAASWRAALPATMVIGITGNVGKTTTKLIAAAVLATRYRVEATPLNYNNEIGVPLCLLELRPEVERAVIEHGMYTAGEIARLCEWTRPCIGAVLNVGPVHLERAGSMETIARAKRELVEALPAGGHAVLNADDPVVRAMAGHTAARVWLFGEGPEAEVRGSDIEGHGASGFSFTLTAAGRSARLRVPLPGKHLLSNVLAAATVGLADGVPFEAVVEALERLDVPLRLTVRALPGGVTLLDDTYNASPAATVAALDLLAELPGRRVALLGDMRELGPRAEELHRIVGRRAAEVADVLYTVGEEAAWIAEAARAAGLATVTHLPSKTQAAEALRETLAAGDALLVKGSRALALETVVAELEDGPGDGGTGREPAP